MKELSGLEKIRMDSPWEPKILPSIPDEEIYEDDDYQDDDDYDDD